MQQSTRRELKKVKAAVRQVLQDHPATRSDDNALYYYVCTVSYTHLTLPTILRV